MEDNPSSLNQQIQRLSAEMALIKAQQSKGPGQISPWLPLKDAAERLHFKSARALGNRIKNGQFPPECVRIDPTCSASSPRYLVHVERYIKQLR
jgi:hypothetical protein